MPIKPLLRLTIAALVIAVGFSVLLARPTSACVDLDPGFGSAVWFYRSCTGSPADGLAEWTVEPNPNRAAGRSLAVGVQNAFPGYRLECDLYFLNNGQIPFTVKNIEVANPNPVSLTVSAVEVSSRSTKKVVPCNFTPAWGTNPGQVPANCQSRIHFSLALAAQVPENAAFPFSVHVRLQDQSK